MSQDYSPSLVTKNLVFCGDAAMKSAAGPATLLYDKVNDNNGTMYNGACLDFDGTNDYVTIPHNLILDNENALTIECWINTSFDAAFPGEIGVIRKGSGSASGWSNAGWSIRLRDDIPAIAFRKKDDSGYWDLYTGDKIIDGNWHHIVGTFDTTTLRKYVDGVETQSTSTGQAYLTTTENLEIGRISAYLDGSISNVKLYNVALSAANVKELYDDSKVIIPTKNDASGGFVTQTNLTGWWPLGDGAGTIAYDGSGNGNHGTLTNMDPATDWLTAQTGAPQLVEGYNRPMLFDGSNDYVQVASDGSSTFANQSYTVAGWIKLGPSRSSDSVIFSYDHTSHSTPHYAIQVRVGTNGSMFFGWNNGSTYKGLTSSAGDFTDDTWHHFACTYTSGAQKIYADGVQVAAATESGTITFYQQEVYIGRASDTGSWGGGAFFEGIINETVVYNSVLTLAQVQALAATGPNGGPLPPDPMSLSNSSNVIGYWRNDGNVTWTDRSANSNTGTVYGSPDALLFKQGINGSKNVNTGRDGQGFPLKFENVGAVGFNGTDATGDYIDCGDLGTIGDEFTYSVWFKTGPSTAATYRMFMCVDGNTNGNPQIRIYNGNVQMRFYNDNTLATTGTTYWDGKWHQVVGGINGSGDYFLYVDGVDKGTLTPASYTVSWSGNTRIGKYNYAGGKFFEGQIANAQIYNRALTYAEIQQNYNSFKARFG